uniref:Uncharacterized protein n=1 Tax=Arundo donax TaxID=35708 RepID=A0A0A9E0M2_ARUDO
MIRTRLLVCSRYISGTCTSLNFPYNSLNLCPFLASAL